MFAYWKFCFEMARLGLEAERVIAMRLARIAQGGAAADAESRLMVSEKFAAADAARIAAAMALVSGKGIDIAMSLALAPVRHAVRANHRRLLRAKRFDDLLLPLRRIKERIRLAVAQRFRRRTRP